MDYGNKKRRFLVVLFSTLAVCLSLAILAILAVMTDEFPASGERGGKQILSEMSDHELILFLNENEVTIPLHLANSRSEVMEVIRSFIIDIEQKPDIAFIYGLTQSQQLGDALKPVVNAYYGISVD